MAKLGYTWYPKDWGNSDAVFQLTLIERGLYRELIDMSMLNDNTTEINYRLWTRKFATTKDELETILRKIFYLFLVAKVGSSQLEAVEVEVKKVSQKQAYRKPYPKPIAKPIVKPYPKPYPKPIAKQKKRK